MLLIYFPIREAKLQLYGKRQMYILTFELKS
ncbi:hypothetical protein Cylst_5055 [Cylindrospermum stagnale PCC 7417]|uniref:Uncharacterized protein n=1 Tax=Cylindrospermum stagnale PCC 7417 TaxID=56107 RepID=K9X4Y5_9NOST|nr:hypothetical protein Cylst_5055 [Cylindrospermum stagnale PCC 7417]